MKNQKTRSLVPVFLLLLSTSMDVGCSKKDNADESTDSAVPAVAGSGGGTSTSTGDATVSLSIQGTLPAGTMALQSASEIVVLGPDGTAIGVMNVSVAEVALEKIEFKKWEGAAVEPALTEESEEPAAEVAEVKEPEFKGPFVVDLLTNVITPTPDTTLLQEGLYKSIKLGIHKLAADEVGSAIDPTDPIVGNSVYVAGTYTPTGGVAKPFTMSFELSEEFELISKNGFLVSSQSMNDVIIAFRLTDWFSFNDAEKNATGLSFNSLTTDSIDLTGESGETAKKVREIIKENIKTSAEVGKDDDGDGELGDSEDGDEADDEEELTAE